MPTVSDLPEYAERKTSYCNHFSCCLFVGLPGEVENKLGFTKALVAFIICPGSSNCALLYHLVAFVTVGSV